MYSTEQLRYPKADGSVGYEKQAQQGAGKMDCSSGFGSFVGVTSNFGMIAASRAIRHLLK